MPAGNGILSEFSWNHFSLRCLRVGITVHQFQAPVESTLTSATEESWLGSDSWNDTCDDGLAMLEPLGVGRTSIRTRHHKEGEEVKVTRSLAIATLALCGWLSMYGQARADGNSTAAQQCAQTSQYVLYRNPAIPGSAGIASISFVGHGDCVAFFGQNPTYIIIEVHPIL